MGLRRRFKDSKLVGSEETTATELITRDANDVEVSRRLLTEAEIAHEAAQGQPTPKETALADIDAASTITALKAALTKWIGG